MKAILFALLMTMSSLAFTQDTTTNEDRSRNPNREDVHEVLIMKSKCNFSRNIDIKVRGLETFGRLGTRELTANVPFFDSCNDVLMGFNQTMSRGMNKVNTKLYLKERRTREMRGNRLICRTYQSRTLVVIFPQYPELEFLNSEEVLIAIDRDC
ncbi:MAG: hypothetical protein EP319_18375 [Deltaproteobacteria bacterium]|nr:MAG: hypothetical protein EP319_18375 [Deltaproteobacteria bacterium]